jgi:hypothetical protein
LPTNQKTFQVYFSFKQLLKIKTMFAKDSRALLGVSGIDSLDQTINKTVA